MSTVGYSTLDVIPSMKGFRSKLEQGTSPDMAAAGRTGGRKYGDAAGKEASSTLRDRFKSGMKGFSPFAGVAIGAGAIALFKGAIGEASALAESGNKINVIFGDAADQVNRFADSASEGLGQSDLQARNAAASFGVYGKAAGLAGDALATFSTDLTSLASDLASFYDSSVDEAIQAIGSGLRGEAEPLRAFGVLLDDATLRQEALRQGLIATTKQALTPQQKVLAAQAVIMAQTAVAQGDFARTADGLANSSRDLSADWADMRAELGEKLLPTTQSFVGFLKDDGLPALSAAGGVASDTARAFGDLPGPVKAAAGAFVALRLASATGVTGGIGRGVAGLQAGLDVLRTRANFAASAFSNARANVFVFGATSGQAVGPVSRLSASMQALRAASFGAGAGLKRGLSSALSLVGGPWGVAFIAGTAILTKFWLEHQKAKQRVEDFTATLDKQTGALTENSREFAAKQLADSGVLAAAERLGVSLETVTNAALGLTGSYAALRAEIGARGQLGDEAAADAIKVKSAIDDQNGVVQKSIVNQRLFAAALGHTADAQGGSAGASTAAGGAADTYATKLTKARDALRSLLDVENERRNKSAGAFADQTRLAEALGAARKEAAEGKKTLDENTEAGQENRNALSSLVDAWNNSADSVKNANGAYKDMRQNFIDVATDMGATKGEAKLLADEILNIPKSADVKFQSKGFKERLAEIRRLKEEAQLLITLQFQRFENKKLPGRDSFATGGMIGGRGSGTSDSNLIWASRGEFMQRKAAVDYYGVDFMAALNALQVPRYRNGGPIGQTTTTTGVLGQEFRGTLAIDRDGVAYIRGVARDAVAGADAQRQRDRRMSASDGISR